MRSFLSALAALAVLTARGPAQYPTPPINLAPQWPASQASVVLRVGGETIVLRGNGQFTWCGRDAAGNAWRFYGSGLVVASSDSAVGPPARQGRQDWTTKSWDPASRTLILVPTLFQVPPLPGDYRGLTAVITDL